MSNALIMPDFEVIIYMPIISYDTASLNNYTCFTKLFSRECY